MRLIAREAELPVDAIDAKGPFDLNVPLFEQEPTAEKRSSQIIGERALYRLRFDNNPDLPIISVFAQAPTPDEAAELAGAAPAALRSYIERLQARQDTPPDRRVEIRRLGDATGGVVNDGANLQIAALVFIVAMAAWCMLLIPARTIAQGWRSLRDADEDRLNASRRKNGAGSGGRRSFEPMPGPDRMG